MPKSSVAAKEVRLAQVELLFANIPVSLGLSAFLGALATSLLWNTVARSTLLTWLGALVFVSVLRALVWAARRHFKETQVHAIALWHYCFLGGALLAGCVWGALGPLVAHHRSLSEISLAAFILAGASAAAATSLGADRRAALLFVIPALVPFAVTVFIELGDAGHQMGAMLVLYCAFIAISAHRAHRTIVENVRLRLEAQDAHREIARSETRRAAMIDSALDCIITIDARGKIIEFNPAAERTFSFARAEAMGRSLAELIIPSEQREAHTESLGRYRRGQASSILGRRVELMAQRRNGERFPVELTVLEVGSETDLAFTAYVRDISERKASEVAVKAKETAEAASRAKSAFLAAVSHEIRTPLNAILGQLELLSHSPLDGDQRDTVALVHESSQNLLSLIDDILDFSKIEAGKLEIRREPVDLGGLIEHVHGIFSAIASSKGLVLSHAVGAEVPAIVLTDGLRLRQILSNLLSNAIKFTERGTITITIGAMPRPGQAHWTRVQVRDSGIGMSEATLAKLFEPFEQGHSVAIRRAGGTGLGLAISRRLATALGGTLTIASPRGEGTVATLELPLEPSASSAATEMRPDDTVRRRIAQQTHAPTVEAAARAGHLILTVDDYPANRKLLMSQLNWLGYAAEGASDGAEALDKYTERRAEGTPYALVITDCQMPRMDGFELARRIRASETTHTPILAFTANTLAEAAAACRAVGIDDVLHKPVSLADLFEKVARFMPNELRAAQILEAVRGPGPSAPTWTPEVFLEFRAAHEEDLESLQEAVRTQDFARISRTAHGIKGAARMLGDAGLAHAATELERAARASDAGATKAAVAAVETATQRLYHRAKPAERRSA